MSLSFRSPVLGLVSAPDNGLAEDVRERVSCGAVQREGVPMPTPHHVSDWLMMCTRAAAGRRSRAQRQTTPRHSHIRAPQIQGCRSAKPRTSAYGGLGRESRQEDSAGGSRFQYVGSRAPSGGRGVQRESDEDECKGCVPGMSRHVTERH